ncbi:MAG: hypothetical protein NTU72_00195 [Fimbriimonadales bacterium]|nr:hypothetical protein [Fimbriimonadales bacterium]
MDLLQMGNIDQNITEIESEYANKTSRRIEFDMYTENLRQEYRVQIRELTEERHKAMVSAANHAGNIGLVYHPRTNSFARVVISDDLPPLSDLLDLNLDEKDEESQETETPNELPQELKVQPTEDSVDAPVAPPEVSLTDVKPVENGKRTKPVKPEKPQRPLQPMLGSQVKKRDWSLDGLTIFSFLISIFVGLFVGNSLFSILGQSKKTDDGRVVYLFCLAAGVGAIWSLKLLFGRVWYQVGRRRALQESQWHTSLWPFTVTAFLCSCEAVLGSFAIRQFSEKTTIEAKDVISYPIAILIAITISTATLLLSVYLGIQKGERSIQDEDLAQRNYFEECKRIDKEYEEQKRDYSLELEEYNKQIILDEDRERESSQAKQVLHQAKQQQKLELMGRHHQAQIAAIDSWMDRNAKANESHASGVQERSQRVEEYESLQKLPDYQALLKYISIVEALSLRIEEFERQNTNEQISRGYRRKVGGR